METPAKREIGRAERPDATDLRFGTRALLIVMAVVAVATSVVAAFVRSFPRDVWMVLALYWCALATALVAFIALFAWRRRKAELKAGKVLFECDRYSFYLPKTSRLVGTAATVGGLLGAPAAGFLGSEMIAQGGWTWEFNYALLACLTASAGGIANIWWRRIRLAENGLILRSQFFPWAVCNRWRWHPHSKNVAIVSTTSRGKIAFEVPEDQRAAIESLLERNVYVRFREKV